MLFRSNVPLIVGLAKALELCQGSAFGMSKSLALTSLRDYFWQKIKKEIPTAVLNGDPVRRLPNNLNISLPGLDSEFTVICLDEAGIISSTRSACSHDEDGSAVVRALGQGQSLSRSTLRFSLGEDITKKDIDFVVKKLTEIVKRQKLASL